MARPSGGRGSANWSSVPKGGAEAAAQIVPMYGQPKGIDRFHSSSRVGPDHAVRIVNLMFDDGVLASRRGTELMGGEAASPVMQVVDFIRPERKKVTIRFCTRHVEIFQYGTGTWRSFPVPLTGSSRDFFAYTGWADKLLFSNGIDGLWEFDFTTMSVKLVPGAPGAKHLTTFGGRVVASAATVGGVTRYVRVQWSVKNDYTKWNPDSDIGAGFEELYGSPGGITDEAMGVFPIDDTNAYLVRARSVYQMSLSGNVAAPFRFDRVLPDIGSPFRNSIVTALAGIVFASRENIHMLDTSGHKLIGDLVIDDILDEHSSLNGCFGAFDAGRLEYRLAVDFDVWRYRLQEQGWTSDTYPFSIRSLSRQLQGRTGIPIDSLPGIIDGLSAAYPPGKIDDLIILRESDNGMMFVPDVNSLTMWETDALTDVTVNGNEFPATIELETGVINSDPFNACELHEIHLEYEAKSPQQLLFDATFNEGVTFQPISFKDIEETDGSEIAFVKTERVSRKLRLSIRSFTLGSLRILGLAPLIVKVNRHMASRKPKVASIEVLPSPLAMSVGGMQQLNIILRGQNGEVIQGRPPTILSSNNKVATVSSGGLVRAVAAGEFAVVVSSGNTQVSVSGTVSGSIQAAVALITVTPGVSQGETGTTQQFTATLRDVNGNVLVGRQVVWGSSNNAVATAVNGLVTLLAEGSVVISATAEGVTGGSTLTVVASVAAVSTVTVTPSTFSQAVGEMVQLVATVKDASDNVLAGKTISWASDDLAIATVTATGLVTMLAPGSVTITATCETVDGDSLGTVVAAPATVSTVTVTPSSFTLAPGTTQLLTVTVKDSAGNVLTGRTVTFSSSNNAVATVSSGGVVTAVSQGSVTISATCEGKVGQSSGTVTGVVVDSVSVNPNSFSLETGGTVQLAATPRDSTGAPVLGRTVAWGSSDVTKATVSSTGLVTAVGTGSVTITATCETKTGTSSGSIAIPTPEDLFPEITVTLPTGLTHDRNTDLINGVLFDTAVNPDYLQGGTATVVSLIDTGNAATNFTNLQNALNSAARHTTIKVPSTIDFNAGASRLELPAKALVGTQEVYIVSQAVFDGTFPRSESQMVQDSDEPGMPTLRGANTLGVMNTAASALASYYRFIGFKFITEASDCTNFAVSLGNNDPTIQTSLATTPRNLILDRVIVRPQGGTIGGQGGVGMNARYTAVIGSRVQNWKSSAKSDPNAIANTNGAGPMVVYHNFLDSLGETIMFGGGLDQAAADMIPSDIHIKHNIITAPVNANPNHPSFAGQTYSGKKNVIETKGARRVLIEFNRLSHSWVSAQSGQGITGYAVNQTGNAPWIVNENFVVRYNEWDDINTFFHFVTRGFHPTADGTKRFHVANNVTKNLNGPYTGPGVGRCFLFLRDLASGTLPGMDQMTFRNNTVFPKDANRTGLTLIEFTGPAIAEGGQPHTNFLFQDNILGNTQYGIFSPQGQGSAAFAAHAPGTVFSDNIVIEWQFGDFSVNHPTGNVYVPSIAAVGFVDPALENYELLPTSPYKGTGSDGRDPGVNFTLLNSQLALI